MTTHTLPPDLELIPEDVRPRVLSAIAEAFPGQALEGLAPVRGGFSRAIVLQAVVGRQPRLLRIERAQDALHDPVRAFACMSLAAEQGLSPRVHVCDGDAGIAVVDWVEMAPLSAYPGGAGAVVPEVAAMIRRLQAGPAFPTFVNWFDGIDGIFGQLQASGLFAAGVLDPVADAYARIKAAYPRVAAAELVASHNDLNPANILYDGRRLWLIDWETGFANDPHVDPAMLALWFTLDEDGEADLLMRVFGDASDARRARLWLMRQVCSVFYGALSLLLAAQTLPRASQEDLAAPSFLELRAALAQGSLNLGSADGAVPFGKRLLGQVADCPESPRFAWAASVLA